MSKRANAESLTTSGSLKAQRHLTGFNMIFDNVILNGDVAKKNLPDTLSDYDRGKVKRIKRLLALIKGDNEVETMTIDTADENIIVQDKFPASHLLTHCGFNDGRFPLDNHVAGRQVQCSTAITITNNPNPSECVPFLMAQEKINQGWASFIQAQLDVLNSSILEGFFGNGIYDMLLFQFESPPPQMWASP
ncbi:hypothetical protein EV421DRAFT_1744360 [Armillaria borealis]|uniref:Uncharacterized protein n=1 Tax=Armillaria borealis TaxID=47425 RepID=A0AA39MDG6_9AGAR|nr:hypothetical protein EV421DRAFT_1744360 [Armillaria borealis]